MEHVSRCGWRRRILRFSRPAISLPPIAPSATLREVKQFALDTFGLKEGNVDGQQVTQMTCCQDSFGNPRYSKDSIAEFEVITPSLM